MNNKRGHDARRISIAAVSSALHDYAQENKEQKNARDQVNREVEVDATKINRAMNVHAEEETERVKDAISSKGSIAVKLEDKFSDVFLEDDSLPVEKVLILHNRIDSLKC